jgi:16S rRNA (cytosine967-C5)-methyltransferase
VIERTLLSGRPTTNWMRRVESGLDDRDRALLHQLVTGVLRWVLRLDDVLVQVGGKPVGMIDPRLLGPLRLGALQLLFLDRIPPHAAVNESVRLAHDRSHPGSRFVNALLRKLSKEPELSRFPVKNGSAVERLAIETSHPVFLVERWQAHFGERATAELLAANNGDRKATFLAVGGADALEPLIEDLAAEGVEATAGALSPLAVRIESGRPLETGAFKRGALYPQDEASQCAALIPPPVAGERVLDAAAAPGGKTLALLAWERNLSMTSGDRSLARLMVLRENARRTRSDLAVVVSDGRYPGLRAVFDRVIADLPCSGTGTLRKHPELKWRTGSAELLRQRAQGATILGGLAQVVAPGGLLIVSTCSIEPEENEQQVAEFLRTHADFSLLELGDVLPSSIAAGIRGSGLWQVLPGAGHDGFTVHVLKRTT